MDKCKVFFINVESLSDDVLFEKYYNMMSEFRQQKIMRFVRRQDRNLSLGAGILTDVILREYGFQEKSIHYGQGEYGKPFFINHPEIKFNISHSGSFSMAVSSDNEVGCDIEEDKEIDSSIGKLILSPEEVDEDILKIWTMKESFLKKEGCGLNNNLTKIQADKINNIYQIDAIKGYRAFVCTQKPSELEIRTVSLECGGKLWNIF